MIVGSTSRMRFASPDRCGTLADSESPDHKLYQSNIEKKHHKPEALDEDPDHKPELCPCCSSEILENLKQMHRPALRGAAPGEYFATYSNGEVCVGITLSDQHTRLHRIHCLLAMSDAVFQACVHAELVHVLAILYVVH